MEEDEHDHGLGLSFHGLEPILGTTYEFSCGSKSAGKFTVFEGQGRPTWHSPNGGFKLGAFFIYFWHISVFSILLLLSNTFTTNAQWFSGKGVYAMAYRTRVRIPGPPYALYYFVLYD